MTAQELKEVFSKIDFNSLSDDELDSVNDLMAIKGTEIKCIIIRRKHLKIRHPLPKDNTASLS